MYSIFFEVAYIFLNIRILDLPDFSNAPPQAGRP
jgi:hypothetical protein